MIHIFFDTEFTELGIDPKLISIGMIAEDGERTFYAELCDTWQLNDASAFAREAVLPLLEGGTALMTMKMLRERLKVWIESFGEPVKLATDSLSWDWPWIQEIFYELGDWPSNLNSKPEILLFDAGPGEKFNVAVEKSFAAGLRRHHALDDAKANRLGWLATDN
jgi:hypothetical protein